MELKGIIESILFVASKPLTLSVLAKSAGASVDGVREILEALKVRYNHEDSGIHIVSIDDEYAMVSNSQYARAVEQFVTDDVAGDLTKAQLETLTVIAYQGPITRPELERIRGVNCALIVRNLLVRGLIEEKEDATQLSSVYVLSFDALRHLGIASPTELPDYETLHAHPHVTQQ